MRDISQHDNKLLYWKINKRTYLHYRIYIEKRKPRDHCINKHTYKLYIHLSIIYIKNINISTSFQNNKSYTHTHTHIHLDKLYLNKKVYNPFNIHKRF